ncbi:MAG: response regulator [Myxococcaceae bacterium]
MHRVTGHQQLLLLAEDDQDQRELLAEVLEFEGYRVLQAENSNEVVQQLKAQPNALLMDLHGISSPAVSAAFARLEPRPALMVLSADRQLGTEASKLGADAFLSKPYNLDELLQALQRMLGPPPKA